MYFFRIFPQKYFFGILCFIFLDFLFLNVYPITMMNKEIFAYTVKNEGNPSNYLDVNNAGIVYATNNSQPCHRPYGRNDYLLIYVHQGKVKLSFPDDEVVLEHHYVIYKPYQPQHYVYMASPNSEVYWLHFNGVFAPKILEELRMTSLYHPVKKIHSLPMLFEEIISFLRSKEENYSTKCNYTFLKILSLLSSSTEDNLHAFLSAKYTKIAPAVDSIRQDPSQFKTLEDLAALCNLPPSTFAKIFTKNMGISPITYLNNKKLERSLYFLLESDYNINEIAQIVGYENQFYYSKKFKQAYELSPLQYRKQHAGLSDLKHEKVRLKTKEKNLE